MTHPWEILKITVGQGTGQNVMLHGTLSEEIW
jgi:hypothetical protein